MSFSGSWTTSTTTSTNLSNTFLYPSYDRNAPRLIGPEGQAEVSTCLDLDIERIVVWDTNTYYASLGVRTDATRKELREAYVARNGHDDRWITHCFLQLIDREKRRLYDRTPFGCLFRDRYIDEMLQRKQMEMERQMRIQARAQGIDLDAEIERQQRAQQEAQSMWDAIPDDVDDAPHGAHRERPKDLPEVVDTPPELEQDAPSPPHVWPYSYYVWRSSGGHTELLEKWQRRVGYALAKRGITTKFAVGWVGFSDPVVVRAVGNRTVVFLGEGEQPTKRLARQAASQMVKHLRDGGDKKISASN